MGNSKTTQEHIQDVHEVQGRHGNWNSSPYMLGMFNGLELALAIIEDREPQYKDKPDKGFLHCFHTCSMCNAITESRKTLPTEADVSANGQ